MADYLEPLTWQHIRAGADLGWGGWEGWTDNKLRYLPMVGYAAFSSAGELLGLGGVIWIGKTAIATLALAPGYAESKRSRWVHRHAVEVLALAHRIAPEIEAYADPDIPRSAEFLARLGFAPLGEEKWLHGVCNSDSASGRLIRREQLCNGGLARDGGRERLHRDAGG